MDGVVEMRDVFSELPDDVLIHILSCLPTLDSVQTMLLRRFGDLWTLVPTLHFDFYVFGQPQRFMKFVRHVMLLHQAPFIHSFILVLCHGYLWDEEKDVVMEIQTWIKCALRKEPKLVSLHFRCQECFPLPLCFFPNQSLVELILQRCQLKQRRHKRVQMGSLRSLILADMIMDESEIFNEIISGCPSLERLYLAGSIEHDIVINSKVLQELVLEDYGCSDFTVKLSCPNVKILHLTFLDQCFEILDISRVCDVTIHFSCLPEELFDFLEYTQLLLKSLQNVEVLRFCGLLLKDNVFPQNRWKTLTLTGIVNTEPCVVWINDLVRKSPMLEDLTIMTPDVYKIEHKSDEMCPELASPCIAPRLRKVEIGVEKNYDDQVVVQSIKFFLKSAVVLAELIISPKYKWGERFSKRKMNDLLKRTSCFSEASSNTRIIIN